MLKIAAAVAVMIAVLPVSAFADKAKMRAASESEIRERMDERSKDISTRSNGYTYVRGNPSGYKIANGEICIRFPNGARDCANVETDGNRFEMITRDGSREAFGN